MKTQNFFSFLAKSSVKDDIINFDAHQVTPDLRKKVSELMKRKPGSFDPKNAKRASAAAAPLAVWVTANLQYAAILEKIAPLENEKAALQKNLSKAERQMDKLSKGLKSVDDKVADLRARFESFTKEATEIKIGLEKEQETIKSASTLVTRLEGEYKRWNEQMNELKQSLDDLPKLALIAASYVTFLGAEPEEQRRTTLQSWMEVLGLSEFSLRKTLSNETEQLQWKTEGLPNDELSVENAAIILKSQQTPLIIDPSSRAILWLTEHMKDKKVELISQGHPNFITQVELAVRFGKTLIVTGVDQLEPALYPLLRKDKISQGLSATRLTEINRYYLK